MKARKLKKLLNNTGYTIQLDGEKICIGGAYCNDLISVNMETLKIKTASHIEGGRGGFRNDELVMIWDKLTELIESGEIKDIIEGKDEIENPLTVYTVQNGELKECITDEYGWPNVTDDGFLMYENQYFRTKKGAIRRGIEDLECQIISSKQLIDEYADKLKKHKDLIKESEKRMRGLKETQGFSCSNCDRKGCYFLYPPGDYHCFVPGGEPRWETPEQYQARTGNAWPDNWAVYCRGDNRDGIWREWIILNYKCAKGGARIALDRGRNSQIVCATEAGIPPDDWRLEESQ